MRHTSLFSFASLTSLKWWARLLRFANLLVPYNESIQFEVGYNIGKNLADIIADFTSYTS